MLHYQELQRWSYIDLPSLFLAVLPCDWLLSRQLNAGDAPADIPERLADTPIEGPVFGICFGTVVLVHMSASVYPSHGSFSGASYRPI